MDAVRVQITRYVDDEPQPGIVECKLIDASGKTWRFVEKSSVVSSEHLSATTTYPRRGVIACQVLRREVDGTGEGVAVISTKTPWMLESVEGETEFCVHASTLTKVDEED